MLLLSPCYMALMRTSIAKRYHHTNASIYTYVAGCCFVSLIIATFQKIILPKLNLNLNKSFKMHQFPGSSKCKIVNQVYFNFLTFCISFFFHSNGYHHASYQFEACGTLCQKSNSILDNFINKEKLDLWSNTKTELNLSP